MISTDRRSEEFRAGMAYAAHIILHMVSDRPLDRIEPKTCCQDALVAFALGAAEGLEDGSGLPVERHGHFVQPVP